MAGPTIQSGVGFQPDYETEGKFEALEFSAGNYGLLESALDYARDDERPKVRMTGPALLADADRDDVRVDQRAVRHPLHDGRVEAEGVLAAVGLDRAA